MTTMMGSKSQSPTFRLSPSADTGLLNLVAPIRSGTVVKRSTAHQVVFNDLIIIIRRSDEIRVIPPPFHPFAILVV